MTKLETIPDDPSIDFRPKCPHCGAQDHKIYKYQGADIFVCPLASENKLIFYEGTLVGYGIIEEVEDDKA